MTFSLEFVTSAHSRSGTSSGNTVRQQFKKKLAEILVNPRIEANRLRDLPDCYKIKLRSVGYRPIYQVIDQEVVVFVVAVDKCENQAAYKKSVDRLK